MKEVQHEGVLWDGGTGGSDDASHNEKIDGRMLVTRRPEAAIRASKVSRKHGSSEFEWPLHSCCTECGLRARSAVGALWVWATWGTCHAQNTAG